MQERLTLNLDWVRIFSTKSSVGILSFRPPKGAFSTFTKPFRSRTLLLPPPRQAQTSARRDQCAGLHRSHQTAFIMRRLMVKYSSPMRMTGNWSSTPPPLGCTQLTTPSFRSRNCSICLLHGGCGCGQASPLCTSSTACMSTAFIRFTCCCVLAICKRQPAHFHALVIVFKPAVSVRAHNHQLI